MPAQKRPFHQIRAVRRDNNKRELESLSSPEFSKMPVSNFGRKTVDLVSNNEAKMLVLNIFTACVRLFLCFIGTRHVCQSQLF